MTQGEARVRNNCGGVDKELCSQPITSGARAEWIIKRKQAWLNFVNRETRNGAGKSGRENQSLIGLIGKFKHSDAIGQLKGCFETIGQSIAHLRLDHNSVNNHINIMLDFLIERRNGIDLVKCTIHFNPLKTALLEFLKIAPILAFASANDGGQ